MATVQCPQCGAQNPAGSRFCASCGITLTQRLKASSQPLPQQPTGGGTPSPAQAGGTPAPSAPASPVASTLGQGGLLTGMTLQGGRYVIDRALGGGGMGSVYLVHDTRVSNKRVVVKEMLNSFATAAERREAEAEFQAEASTMAALNYANIPSISDFFSEGGRNFLVQGFVEGQDLQHMLDAAAPKALPEKQVMGWMSQVLGAMEYMAAQNPQVIHRDIKPANIIVDLTNRAWLVDFGVASQKFRPGSTGALQNALQQSTPLGTPGYAPPEQFSGNETVLSDVFALGATMHHLLTGRDPRQFTDPKQLWVYPHVRQLNPRISERTAHIVERATQRDPRKRYPSAAAMKREVDRVASPPGALSTFRGRAIALLALLVLLLVAVSGSFIYTRQQALLPATGFVSTGAIAFDRQVAGRGAVGTSSGTASDPAKWAAAKVQASLDYKNGNMDRARAGYLAATGNDQTDAESWIYLEDMRAEAGALPPYTIAVGSSFSGADVSTGRQLLQGVYTAQKVINDAGGINGHLLRLVLANDASSADGALQAARKVAARADVLAMVGFSFSSRTAAALQVLPDAKVTLLSPTASNPNLNTTPYFFRVCPSDTYQGAEAVRYMLSTLLRGKSPAHLAVFSDPNDKYSNGLGSIVSAVAQAAGVHIIPETYAVDATPDFTAQARNVLAQHADLVYFAGYAHDALLLARALDELSAPAALQIMSDDAFYNPGEFIAQPGHKSRFHFTGFFYPDEGGLVQSSHGRAAIAAMETEYTALFHRADLALGGYGSSRVSSDVALSYDALTVLAEALRFAGATPTRQSVRDALAGVGTSAPAYAGISGRIAFDPHGDPMNKALLVMHLNAAGRTKVDSFLGTF